MEESSVPVGRRASRALPPSIQVSKDAHDEDKTFSPKITCPALELINIQHGNIGFHLQVPRGGTHPNGVGSELTFFLESLFFVTVGFGYSWKRSTVTDGKCEQNTLTPRMFSHICTHFILVHMHRMAQGVARCVS